MEVSGTGHWPTNSLIVTVVVLTAGGESQHRVNTDVIVVLLVLDIALSQYKQPDQQLP